MVYDLAFLTKILQKKTLFIVKVQTDFYEEILIN